MTYKLISFATLVVLVFTQCLILNASPLRLANPVLMVSLDGFQANKLDEFLRNNPGSAFAELISAGVKAKYMVPSFPSLTFPNHVTLVTGRYPETHGIVANRFYDPNYNEKVSLTSGINTLDAKWWNQSEPIWITARRLGLKTASFFWTGSEVLNRSPDIYMTYNNRFPTYLRVDEVINWIFKFNTDLTFLYFNEPDHTGHDKGPDSEEYMLKIVEMDGVIRYLLTKLKQLELYDKLNLIITSDHGITQMKPGALLIHQYVNMAYIDDTKTIYGIVNGIHPIKGREQDVYNSLKKMPNAQVYYKKDVPTRYAYSNNNRIGPIVVITDEGYTLSKTNRSLAGDHGFDNEIETMRTIFLAHGPSFRENVELEPFQNVNVYPLLCRLLDIDGLPNNGTADVFDSVLIQPTPVPSPIDSSIAPSDSSTPSSLKTTPSHANTSKFSIYINLFYLAFFVFLF